MATDNPTVLDACVIKSIGSDISTQLRLIHKIPKQQFRLSIKRFLCLKIPFEKNELPRSKAARYQNEFLSY